MSASDSAATPHPVAAALRAVGLAVAATAVPVNPWVLGALREYPVNYADVMQTYMVAAITVGGLLVGAGAAVRRRPQWAAVGLLILAVAAIAMADRALLAYWGLPHWISDSRLDYRQRPSSERVNTAHNARVRGTRISINRHGFHDGEFPVAKPPGQTRILFLGDSVTMGWGVERGLTFSSRTQALLQSTGAIVRTINAGVEGYAARQERLMFEECLVFAPDRVVLGFVMNDVTDPLVQGRQGFWGFYRASSDALGYLASETGVGRTLQKYRQARFERAARDAGRMGAFVAADAADPRFAGAWRDALAHIRAMNENCRGRGIRFALVVFPETHQLFRPERQEPQRILRDFAARHGVDFLDLTPAFENFLTAAINARFGPEQLPLAPARFREMADVMATAFFLDEVHLSDAGHQAVAILLAERFGLADLGLQPRALTRTLNEAARLTLEPVVRMPAEIDRVWRHGQALTDMGYTDAACAFYGKARERFARARTTLDARMRQLACGPL